MLPQNGLTAAHADPVAPSIFGVTLILAAALIGRYGARRLGQLSVLGELVIGVLLGNFLVCCGFDLMLVLREGTARLDMAKLTLEGKSWDQVAAGLGVRRKRGINRLAVGVGMLPRGEVGLVFASIGKSLGVIDASMFPTVVVMVMVTSLSTPPLLKGVMERAAGSAAPQG